MSALSETSKPLKPAKTTRKRRWTIWRVLKWLVLSVLLVILLAAVYAWTHRYSLIESAARDLLSEQGIESELRIKSISKTRLVVDDIRLSADGKPFFKSQSIIADYQWRDALDGKMERLTFKSPEAWVTIDESGQIIDGWLPPQSEGGEGPLLPPQGIIVDDGELNLQTPYGAVKANISADAKSMETFNARIDVQPAAFAYKDFQGTGGGEIDVKFEDRAGEVKADLEFSEFSYPLVMASDLALRVDMRVVQKDGLSSIKGPAIIKAKRAAHPSVAADDLILKGDFDALVSEKRVDLNGPLSASFNALSTSLANAGTGMLTWDGAIDFDRARSEMQSANGDWSIEAQKALLNDPEQRKALANSLTLNEALSATPVAADFADDVTQMATHTFSGADVNGAGSLAYAYDGISLGLREPLIVKAPRAGFTIKLDRAKPFYEFDRGAESLTLAGDVAVSGKKPVRLNNMAFVAGTLNGYTLSGVKRFSANVSTPGFWTSTTPSKRPVRLAPFAATVRYNGVGARSIVMDGAIDFDGDIPGGYATGLKTKGQLTVDLREDGLDTTFVPAVDVSTIAKFQTTTGWRGEDLSFNLVSDTPFYRRRGNVGTLEAELTDAAGILIDDADARHLEMTFDRLSANGILENGRQDWDMQARGIKVYSDDVPGPGTDVRAAEANMQVILAPGLPPEFELMSPSADVKSRLVNADHLRVDVSGTPENFKLDYANGLIKFTADALPALPMTGDVTFAEGEWVGEAETFLPKADDAPIDLQYRFKDGFGEADVTIDKITFTPGKFQPQALLPALRGKVSRVEGTASADIKISFGEGQELKSSGLVRIFDMNAGTLPGPFEGVNTEIEFTSLFPVKTQGRQTLTLRKFDPGLPLENGTIEYELLPNSVKIHSASWPMGKGAIAIDPVTWDFAAEENRVVLRVENVSLGDFLANFGGGDIKATGDVIGVLPVVIKGVDVKVENGSVGVPNGGVIQFESRHTDAAGTVNETADMAFEALKNFEYNSLEIQMDGPLDGDITVLMDFTGSNPEVFYGTKFRFKVNIQGELVNIARSFKQSQDSIAALKSLKNLDNVSIVDDTEDAQK